MRALRPRTLRVALLLGAASVWSLACSPEEDLLADARAQQNSGETDAAIATLELLKLKHPDTDAAKQVPALAEQWLIEAADSEREANAITTRLNAALKWNPASGQAQLLLCDVALQAGRLQDAEDCLDKQMQGKTPEPEREKRIRAALVVAQDKATEAERARLIASDRPQHWRALVERFPNSPEAIAAKEKLARLASICDDRGRFEKAAQDEVARQAGEFKLSVDKALDEAVDDLRVRRLEAIGAAAARSSSELKELAAEIAVHAIKPGEDKAQDLLRQVLVLQSDSLAELARGLTRDAIENLESYQSGASALLKRWFAGAPKEAKQVEKLLTSAKEACEPAAPDAG